MLLHLVNYVLRVDACQLPHHELIFNESGGWGLLCMVRSLKLSSLFPRPFSVDNPSWLVCILPTTGFNTILCTDHWIIIYFPELDYKRPCTLPSIRSLDLLLQQRPSYNRAQALLWLYRTVFGNPIAAIEHLMNWICSDSDDPGQCCAGHRAAQAGWAGWVWGVDRNRRRAPGTWVLPSQTPPKYTLTHMYYLCLKWK